MVAAMSWLPMLCPPWVDNVVGPAGTPVPWSPSFKLVAGGVAELGCTGTTMEASVVVMS
ncbi:hypothetical protein HanIR_Chr15g0734881 [Helianthus annuus]|nr:hypothetical protein HanIR_Chr15g0734881 [Helianthus annuus]